jgi:hypothetical protein
MALGDYYLAGTRLDNANRSFSESQAEYGAKERMLDGSLRADIAARKWTFAMNWEWLPETSAGTYHAWTDLRALGTAGGTYTFIRPTGTGTGTAQYTVMLEPPSADQQFRLDGTDCYWNVNLTMMEV